MFERFDLTHEPLVSLCKVQSTLLIPSLRNCIVAYNFDLKQLLTNRIVKYLFFPKVLKSAAKIQNCFKNKD